MNWTGHLGRVFFFLPLALVLVTGCGGERFAQVTGKVTFKGEPLPGGTVIFANADNTKVVRETINVDGTYTAPRVPFGTVKVGVWPVQKVVMPPLPPGFEKKKLQLPEGVPGAGPYQSKGSYRDIPQHYREPETSNLTLTVDSSEKVFDIDLK